MKNFAIFMIIIGALVGADYAWKELEDRWSPTGWTAQDEPARLAELRRFNRAAYLAEIRAKDPDLWWRELIMAAESDPRRFKEELDTERRRRSLASLARTEGQTAANAAEGRDAATRFCTDRVAAYVAATDFVGQTLRAPATAEFPNYTAAKITPGLACRSKVSAYVDTENGFGATVRLDWTVIVQGDPSRDGWHLVDIEVNER